MVAAITGRACNGIQSSVSRRSSRAGEFRCCSIRLVTEPYAIPCAYFCYVFKIKKNLRQVNDIALDRVKVSCSTLVHEYIGIGARVQRVCAPPSGEKIERKDAKFLRSKVLTEAYEQFGCRFSCA